MSKGFDIVFPAKNPQYFGGGKNNKFQRNQIRDNESPDCLNVVFSDGTVGTRGGSSKLNATAIGSFVCDGLYTRRDDTGGQTMVAFFGGSGWYWNGASFVTIASAQSIFTAGVRVGATQYEGQLFHNNGYIIPHKYDGTYHTRHGVYPPTTTSTVASNAAGVLTGDYTYKITFVNSFSVESDVGPVTATFAAAGATLRITSIPVAPQSWGVSARNIYRVAAGGTTYKRLTQIADNTTTQYDDNTADASLGVTAPTDNGVPPLYSIICQHQNRLFCNDLGNLNYLWYSDLAEPYTFGALNFIKIGDNSGDLIRGIDAYGGDLIIRCDQKCYLLHMPSTTESDWKVIPIRSSYGSKSPFGAALFGDKMLYPAMQNYKFAGFAAISGVNIDPQASYRDSQMIVSDLQSQPIEPDMFDVQEAYVANISAIAYQNKIYASVTYGDNNTTNNRIFVFDFGLGAMEDAAPAWVPWSGINAAQFTVLNNKLYAGSSTANGFVYELNTDTYSDAGSAIDSYFWTKEFAGLPGQEEFIKDFRYINMLIEKLGAWYMELRYRLDSDKGSGQSLLIDLDPGSTLWGTGRWGVDAWGGGSDQEDVKKYLANVFGRRIQFKFSNLNTAGQAFKVHWQKFNYNIRGK